MKFNMNVLAAWAIISLQFFHWRLRFGCVDAFSTGAGGCVGGMAAVGEPHKTSTIVQEIQWYDPTVGIEVYIGGNLLIPPVTVPLLIGVEYTILIAATTSIVYTGFLIRFDSLSNRDISTALMKKDDADETIQYASVCTAEDAIGLTHVNNDFKTRTEAVLRMDESGYGVVDITLVYINNAESSVYSYGNYTIQFIDPNEGNTNTTDTPSISPPGVVPSIDPDNTLQPTPQFTSLVSDIVSDVPTLKTDTSLPTLSPLEQSDTPTSIQPTAFATVELPSDIPSQVPTPRESKVLVSDFPSTAPQPESDPPTRQVWWPTFAPTAVVPDSTSEPTIQLPTGTTLEPTMDYTVDTSSPSMSRIKTSEPTMLYTSKPSIEVTDEPTMLYLSTDTPTRPTFSTKRPIREQPQRQPTRRPVSAEPTIDNEKTVRNKPVTRDNDDGKDQKPIKQVRTPTRSMKQRPKGKGKGQGKEKRSGKGKQMAMDGSRKGKGKKGMRKGNGKGKGMSMDKGKGMSYY